MWWYQCKKMSFCFLRIMNIVSPVTKRKNGKEKKKGGEEMRNTSNTVTEFCNALFPLLLLEYTLLELVRSERQLGSYILVLFGKQRVGGSVSLAPTLIHLNQ